MKIERLFPGNVEQQEAITLADDSCPSCGQEGLLPFHEVRSVPIHSCSVVRTREEAQNFPLGDISLAFCTQCGFMTNTAFDPTFPDYPIEYEDQQAFSPRFSAFLSDLANRLVVKHDLYDKEIVEIGCGKGDFLVLLCELGHNRAVGIDPACAPDRIIHSKAAERVILIQDYYSERYARYHGDLLCCRHTLEHIHPTAEFLSTVRRAIGSHKDTVVFFEVPDVSRILREVAFWDIYYEHCSYFSLGSLARLFRRCGFDVSDLRKDYDDQYIMIEGRPGSNKRTAPLAQEDDLQQLRRDVVNFSESYRRKLDMWQRFLKEIRQTRRRAVLWGGSSKAVAFLTTLNVRDEIEYVVDINPHRTGTYIAGTGQEIVPPDFLQGYRPDVVILMNPVYREEIRQDLNKMGLAPEILDV